VAADSAAGKRGAITYPQVNRVSLPRE